MNLNLSAIRLDGSTQARVELNVDVVEEYAAHLKEGEKFPPVVTFFDGSNYWLADGFHRYHAHIKVGATTIESDVTNGTVLDATLFSFGANGKRGLSLTNEDKRSVITRMLQHPEWRTWTHTAIAKHTGVSSMTVGRVKTMMERREDGVSKKKFTDKNGVVKQIDTSSLGRKKVEVEDVSDVDDHQLAELSDTISSLHAENQTLKDAIAIGNWDASEIEKVDVQDTLKELREQVRILEIDNAALRDSRDMFQARNAELMKTVKSLQAKLKKSD